MIEDDSTALRNARSAYFRDNGLGDGRYEDRWVRIKMGAIPVWLPNTPGRQRAVPLHDLHHIATGYDTSFLGEAEVAAWELGSGCGKYVAAWVINIFAVVGGFLLSPRRIWLAFSRGRSSYSLYQLGVDETLLAGTVGQLRQRLGLRGEQKV